MMTLEQKHLALLGEAERCGQSGIGSMRMCFEVLTLASAIDRSCAARLAPHCLSEGKFVLLFLLRDAPEGLAPHELAKRAGVTRATVTGLLDGLQRDGYLERHHDSRDRRSVSVRLTPKGEATAQQLFCEHNQWISSLFAELDPQELATLSALLKRAWTNLRLQDEERSAVAGECG